MKLTHTLRTCLFFVTLSFTVVLIAATPAKVSPPPKKVSPAPKKVSPAPKKVSPTPAKVAPTPAKASPAPAKDSPPICNRTIKVQVVALDQPWMWNRLGAAQPGGMIYALARDVVKSADGKPLPDDLKSADLGPLCGYVRLRDDKRARPLVLRANKGDCLEITFANLLSPQPAIPEGRAQNPTRWAGLNSTGMELLGDTIGDIAGINSASSWVGKNANSLAKNGEVKTYKWSAKEEGTFLLYSGADMEGGPLPHQGAAYQANQGLFGAIHVEPEGAEWYRSQITHDDLVQATLRQEDLKFSQKIDAQGVETPGAPPTAKASGTAAPQADAQRDLPRGFKPRAMENRIADKVSSLPVYVNEEKKGDKLVDSRILSATKQPLINYYAIYLDDGKPRERSGRPVPVLQMLQTKPIGAPLYDKPLKKENPVAYLNDLRALDAGIIPTDLRKIFADLNPKIDLSAGARVVDQYRYSWLITDQGRAFYVEATPPPGGSGAWTLKISNAELELIYSDLTAVITGPNAARFALSNTSTTFRQIPASPDRRQPYREYTIIYHQAFFATQAFSAFYNANLQNVILAGADNFAINYGSGAIGPEVIANRLGVGPMGNKDSVDLKFEEFFLSAWAVGDPAMVVDHPANATNAVVRPPDQHRALEKEVPAGSLHRQFGTRPLDRVNPPPIDDFAPLPEPPVQATKAFFPDDPSNVYHSYMNDHVKFRILHAGGGPSHVHHLHAHQWLRSPDSDSSSYLDSQLIVPGSAFTLEITYNGSGNRNKTVGDSIFHCHFYPHFAQGMWALWRVHDVFEEGTLLEADGKPKTGVNRALPDGEIIVGTPIPAIVPLPTLAMAPMPAKVELTDLAPLTPGKGQGRRVLVHKEKDGTYRNPGYPFFIPGVSGHRPPHPPLDFAWLEDPTTRLPILDDKGERIHLDGGLPRHIVLDGKVLKEFHTRWDFSKDTAIRDKDGKIVSGAGSLTAMEVPEEGTPVEIAAMNEHAIRTRPMAEPNGELGNFILNGLPATNGAPFADPGVNDQGNANIHRRRYQAAVFQVDTILNKKGWHYPQQRMISLWEDVAPTVDKTRPAEPFFFRTNTSDSIQFWHTNLLPAYYELDDFQVRTPTDIVGQHIHLVKFDVTASDGAGNGFNYEDGTFAPEEVQERIDSINAQGGMYAFDPATGFINPAAKKEPLTLKHVGDYYPPPGSTFVKLDKGVPQWNKPPGRPGSVFAPMVPDAEEWNGAQTTIQLWEVDALLNNEGVDRTLRTVFSHDHFGPSTHQQAGLYAGMVVEPENSAWYLPGGERMNTRADGGPTSWHAYIVPENPQDSYREFMLEFQDMQLAYASKDDYPPKTDPPPPPSPPVFDPAQNTQSSALFDVAQAHSLQQYVDPPPGGTQSISDVVALGYMKDLDLAKLPLDRTQTVGSLTFPVPGFPALFLEFGIPLSKNATVVKNPPGTEPTVQSWTITEAANEINGGTKYVVRATLKGAPPNPDTPRLQVYVPDLLPGFSNPHFALAAPQDPANGGNGWPFPQLVSQNQLGTYSLNYRNEPVPYRVGLPQPSPAPSVSPDQSDLALAFSSSSTIQRADAELNIQPDGKTAGYPKTPLIPNAKGTDPYTPLLEAYVNDRVQIRTLVGAHTQAHALQIHGVKWRFEPDNTNSGWRNAQLMGLSEHFEMIFDLPGTAVPHADPAVKDLPPFADYFYSPSSDIVGLNNGLWGIMRAYGGVVPNLTPLPSNPAPAGSVNTSLFQLAYTDAKKAGRPTRDFDVTAVTASALPGGKLVYNPRVPALSTNAAVIYVRSDDLGPDGKLKAGMPIEPLILRAAAGEWIKVTLKNNFDKNDPAFTTPQRLPYGTPFGIPVGTPFGGFTHPAAVMFNSTKVGLHPQLVSYDPVQANGLLVGFNPMETLVAPGQKPLELYWYAGELKWSGDKLEEKPVEFGGTSLTSADPLLQSQFGMVGALIIEPEGSTWIEDVNPKTKTYASATVTTPGGDSFREFVVVNQNMVANSAYPTGPWITGVVNSIVGAINYRSEPFGLRGPGRLPQPPPQGFSQAFSNTVNDPANDPETPVFTAAAGTPVRFRLLVPGTTTSNAVTPGPVFMVQGHPWQEEPYTADSTKIGFNPLSETQGAQQAGVGQKFDLLFPSAGGQNRIPGDYLYTTYQTAGIAGTWGLFRVTPATVATTEPPSAEKLVTQSGPGSSSSSP
ncbi:MAG TPA: hypothetical protein VGW39_05910 [Chthoniobacterales bacterium]|nr:hypothetical protein [Chthoniobacterales bacterium]